MAHYIFIFKRKPRQLVKASAVDILRLEFDHLRYTGTADPGVGAQRDRRPEPMPGGVIGEGGRADHP
jgi:hypothetical protein